MIPSEVVAEFTSHPPTFLLACLLVDNTDHHSRCQVSCLQCVVVCDRAVNVPPVVVL